LTKTRKFVVNGVVMTSQTSRIVADEMKKHQEHELWSVDRRCVCHNVIAVCLNFLVC